MSRTHPIVVAAALLFIVLVGLGICAGGVLIGYHYLDRQAKEREREERQRQELEDLRAPMPTRDDGFEQMLRRASERERTSGRRPAP